MDKPFGRQVLDPLVQEATAQIVIATGESETQLRTGIELTIMLGLAPSDPKTEVMLLAAGHAWASPRYSCDTMVKTVTPAWNFDFADGAHPRTAGRAATTATRDARKALLAKLLERASNTSSDQCAAACALIGAMALVHADGRGGLRLAFRRWRGEGGDVPAALRRLALQTAAGEEVRDPVRRLRRLLSRYIELPVPRMAEGRRPDTLYADSTGGRVEWGDVQLVYEGSEGSRGLVRRHIRVGSPEASMLFDLARGRRLTPRSRNARAHLVNALSRAGGIAKIVGRGKNMSMTPSPRIDAALRERHEQALHDRQ